MEGLEHPLSGVAETDVVFGIIILIFFIVGMAFCYWILFREDKSLYQVLKEIEEISKKEEAEARRKAEIMKACRRK